VSKHIGIVAVSPEGAALCYRQISRHAAKLVEPSEFPRITMHNEPLALYIEAIRDGDWRTIADLLLRSAEHVARSGAEFAITPDNAIQHGVHVAAGESPIPWLTMTDLVADAVARDNRRVVGLIGTRLVTGGSAYQTALGLRGIRVLSIEHDERDAIDRIIFEELIYGTVRPASRKNVLGIIQNLADRGCEGVILGSSETPLLVTAQNSPLPTYDPSDLLAYGAVRKSMGELD
jgi:aspartate racemase